MSYVRRCGHACKKQEDPAEQCGDCARNAARRALRERVAQAPKEEHYCTGHQQYTNAPGKFILVSNGKRWRCLECLRKSKTREQVERPRPVKPLFKPF